MLANTLLLLLLYFILFYLISICVLCFDLIEFYVTLLYNMLCQEHTNTHIHTDTLSRLPALALFV